MRMRRNRRHPPTRETPGQRLNWLDLSLVTLRKLVDAAKPFLGDPTSLNICHHYARDRHLYHVISLSPRSSHP